MIATIIIIALILIGAYVIAWSFCRVSGNADEQTARNLERKQDAPKA